MNGQWRRSGRNKGSWFKLVKGYLKAGAWFCGEPCVDEAFNCADILILMDITRLNDRYLQRFAPNLTDQCRISAPPSACL